MNFSGVLLRRTTTTFAKDKASQKVFESVARLQCHSEKTANLVYVNNYNKRLVDSYADYKNLRESAAVAPLAKQIIEDVVD